MHVNVCNVREWMQLNHVYNDAMQKGILMSTFLSLSPFNHSLSFFSCSPHTLYFSHLFLYTVPYLPHLFHYKYFPLLLCSILSLSLFLLCLPPLFILPYFSPSCNCRWCRLLSLLAVQSLHLVPVTVHVWHSETETLVLAADTCLCPKFYPISYGPRNQKYCTT